MRLIVRLALVALICHASQATAQEVAFAERGPQFLLTAKGSPERIEANRMPLLRQRISLDLRDVSMHEAITAIARQSGLRLMFGDNVLSRERTVTLRAEAITVAAALTEVLLDAEVDVLFSKSGNAALVRRSASGMLVVGSIAGRVTDANTQQGVEGVRVSLERTRLSTTTGTTGTYRLTGVAAGAYTLVMRRLGYRAVEQAVTVEDGREVIADVTLQPVPSALDEVVVTVTGDQRLRELGHVVGVIRADSLVREAAVANVSDLLTSRVPGMQVFQGQGTVGGRVSLQSRGPNSIGLSNQPIVIIDGIRYTTQDRRSMFGPCCGGGGVESTSPLNDLNVNNIESIEVVKGPSAATLYGTDAANGVVVITTKRGAAGPARWRAYAKGSMNRAPTQRFEDKYWGWGDVFGDRANSRLASCHTRYLAEGSCTQQDSITRIPNGLNDPRYTIFGDKPAWQYGASVGGGSGNLRYYFSADLEDASGPIQMPPAIAEQLRERRGSALPEEWREPNGLTKLNLRSNLTTLLADKYSLQLNTGYVRSDTRTLSQTSSPYEGALWASGPDSPYGTLGFTRFDPMNVFAQTVTEKVDRFLVSSTGNFGFMSWLSGRATIGIDLSNADRYFLARSGDQIDQGETTGAVESTRSRQMATSADLGLTATARRGSWSMRSSAGTQYTRTLHSAVGSFGRGLPAGGAVVQTALDVRASQEHQEAVVLGGYFEELLGFNDRLFISGALRIDGATTFGRGYEAAVYPKVGASWLVSEEPFVPRIRGLNELRLRYAFGSSGTKPNPTSERNQYFATEVRQNGQRVHAVQISGIGNPNLRPERVQEHEIGFDAVAVARRVDLGATFFRRRTTDQLIQEQGPPGRGVITTNLGLTTQHGLEGQVIARIVDMQNLSWNIAVSHAEFRTRLVDIGTAQMDRRGTGGYVEGYPLGARFEFPMIGFSDANGDGIISGGEVQYGDTAVYAGQSIPPRTQTLTSTFGFLQQRLRVSMLAERKSGFTQLNPLRCANSSCRALVDRTTPLEEQARARSVDFTPEPGDFTRLREISVAIDLPSTITRRLGLEHATLVGAGRNLKLWSAFSGADPEVGSTTLLPAANGFSNQQAQGIPFGRVFSLRFDVGF